MRWFLLVAALLAVALARADGFSAEVDRTRIGANETLTLRLSADGQSADEPTLAPLNKDFEVLGQSTGSRVSIVNGAMSQTREWTLELAPRRAGRLQVPPLSQGGRQSKALTVEVVPADETSAGGAPKPIFVETEAQATKPYVQQSFPYRVRVLYREQPRRAILSDPQVEGATLERQGEDRSYAQEVDGQHYTVVERRYRVVPQRSGPLTISGPRLEALMPEARTGARRGPFGDLGDMFGGQGFPDLLDQGTGRRVIERGPDRTVAVRPQPELDGAPWLPAESVELSDEWTPAPPRFRVGEPVTRTLVITARGTTAAHLPTLDPGTPDGAKVYPEPPKVEDLPGAVPTTLKTLKIAVVPTRAGALTLPEIRLAWWDTTTDQARVAVIPQRTVQVEPAAGGGAAPEPAPLAPAVTAPAAPAAVAPPTARPDQGVTSPATPGAAVAAGGGLVAALGAGAPWSWLALSFALAWLLTLVWGLRRQGRGASRAGAVRASGEPGESPGTVLSRVRQACAVGDPRAARAALLDWGRARWPRRPPAGLGDLGARLGPAMVGAPGLLAAIDRAIYAPAGESWDGLAAWQGLGPALVAQERDDRGPAAAALPGLWPGG